MARSKRKSKGRLNEAKLEPGNHWRDAAGEVLRQKNGVNVGKST
jgi:hypothetical protein